MAWGRWTAKLESTVDRWLHPTLDWIQVEVTSQCNAECIYCPHTILRDTWRVGHLSMETFNILLPSFSKTGLVHLQGWGEPLLHPHLFDMVRMVKSSRARVGLTTNGTLVDETAARDMVRSGIDIVALSLAGTTETNDAVRRGTSIDGVLEAIRHIRLAKEEQASDRPSIHVAYLWLRSLSDELRDLPHLLGGLGVQQVVVTTLDFLPSSDLEEEIIRPRTKEEYEELRAGLDHVVAMGRRRGIEIHAQLYRPGLRRSTCTENVRRAAVVSWEGEVSPCVFLGLPVVAGSREAPGVYHLGFGNVKERSFGSIWRRRRYLDFRESFYTQRLFPICEQCAKLWVQ